MIIHCERCKFNDDEIIILICSKNEDSYIRKIGWNVSTTSFRIDRVSRTRGMIVPVIPIEEVWKNNGTDLPILVLFLKPVKYTNSYYPEENSEGYSIEFQETFTGTIRDRCSFFGNECTEEEEIGLLNRMGSVINTGNSFKEGVCEDNNVGFKIIIKRTVGYYDILVRNKNMMMDLMAEVFAMLGATFTAVAYLLVFIEMTKDKSKYIKKIKTCFGLCNKKDKVNKIERIHLEIMNDNDNNNDNNDNNDNDNDNDNDNEMNKFRRENPRYVSYV